MMMERARINRRPRISGSQPLPSVHTAAGKLRLEAALKTLRAYEAQIRVVVERERDLGASSFGAVVRALESLAK